jgi:hypothetical protein
MSKFLVFDFETSGHHMEYIHHLYLAAGKRYFDSFIFAVSPLFREKSCEYDWPKFSNVEIHYLDFKQLKKISGNAIKYSYYYAQLLKETAKRFNINRVFLIALVFSLPLTPFLLNRKYNLSGIVYNIYLYKWKSASFSFKIKNSIQYLFYSYFPIYQKVYILNDKSASFILNKIYKTDKFIYLPDPVSLLNKSNMKDMRTELGIDKNKVVLLHCGSLSISKGTLDILEGISAMNSQEMSRFTFIFAGEMDNTIKEPFYQYYNNLKDQIQIIVIDKFCSFDLFGSLFITSDILLCPYKKRTSQSSGIIGYAAQFRIPVISTKEGLLGKLIKRYDLGIFSTNIKFDLLHAINNALDKKIQTNYIKDHNVSDFTKLIFD